MKRVASVSNVAMGRYERHGGGWILIAALTVIGLSVFWRPTFQISQLNALSITATCKASLAAVGLRAQWEAARFAMYFLTVVAILAALFAVVRAARDGAGWRAPALAGVGLILGYAFSDSSPEGFLSNLTDPLDTKLCQYPMTKCGEVIASVQQPRVVGHTVGGLLAGAIGSALLFGANLNRDQLLRRVGSLRALLLATSAFFVAGVLTTRAAFSWVVALWHSPLGELKPQELVAGGVQHAALTYSAILLAVLLVTRELVGQVGERLAQAEGLRPGSRAYTKALASLHLDDLTGNLGQALTVLAPVLAGSWAELLK
jgi:hypothetical protein